MKKYILIGTLREQTGRKVKNLRLKGILPANVYGKGFESLTIGVDTAAFKTVYAQAGETGVIQLSIDGVERPVLIHNIQRDPVSSEIIHVEFYQVNLKQKVKTNVPIVLVGESPIVLSKTAVLLTLLSEVEVEALPTDLPEKIEVDTSVLTELSQEVLVSDLVVPSGVTILTDASVGVVKATAIVSKEAQEQEAEEAEKAAAAEAAAAAGVTSTESTGESTKEDGAGKPSATPTQEEKKTA